MNPDARVLLAPLVLTSIGAIDYGRRVWLGKRSQNWSPTSGRVVKSEIVRVTARGGGYRIAHIMYRYDVDGHTLTGKAIGFRDPLDTPWEDADRLVDRYEAGREIKVWYDPRKPTRAVLQPGTSRRTHIIFRWWLAGCAFSIVLIILAFLIT